MNRVVAMIKVFEDAGFTLVREHRHQIWRCPCGHAQVVTTSSPCGGRGDWNSKARIKRTLRECALRTKPGRDLDVINELLAAMTKGKKAA